MSGRGRGRGGGRANNVRGPASALTEFLREQGITAQPTNIYARRIRTADDDAPQEESAAGPSTTSTSPTNAGSGAASRPSSGKRGRSKKDDSDLDSDNLDATDEEAPKAPPPKGKGKEKQSEKDLAKAKAKAKAAHEAKRRKRDDDEAPSEDEYKAPSKGIAIAPVALPPIGSFEKCAVCGKTFTVTRYTMAADPPPGFLCHKCAKESGADPFKKTAAPRGRKPAAEKRKIVNYEQKDIFKSLAATCVEIIAKHIDDLEALGDIGQVNMDKISKILARQRSLTESTSKLFYNVENTTLTLYDASRLEPSAFHTLVALNPNLQSLSLQYCRGVDSSVLTRFAADLTDLTHLELYGAFLARAPAFIDFFNTAGSRLESFLLSHSPRLDFDCCQAMVQNGADTLTELRLSNVGKLDDSWLPLLQRCSSLTRLELSYPGGKASLTDGPVIELLSVIGKGIEWLDLSGHPSLGDDVLLEGVLAHVPELRTFKGLCTESDYPYTAQDGTCQSSSCTSASTITGFTDVTPNNSSALLAAIVNQPISVAVDAAGSDWQFYSSGIVSDSGCGTSLDHGVIAVGYDISGKTPYYLVRNSWGSSWGENGYIRLAVQDGAGICGIQMDPSFPTLDSSRKVSIRKH